MRGFINIPFILLILLVAGIAEALTSPDRTTPNERCDIFRGEWIQDPSDPPYTNNTCRFISPKQDCLMNGRPDSGYLHWRWKPHGCDLRPSLLHDFMDAVSDKSVGFVGDSLMRNQVESMVCLLSQVEEPEYTVVASEGRKIWYFPTHNLTITGVWSRHLLKSANAGHGNTIIMHLDVLDTNWTSQFRSFDYAVISTGAWFRSRPIVMLEENKIVACYNCKLANVTKLGYLYAYRRSLQLSFRFSMSEPGHRPGLVLYRSFTPGHFEHGSWSSGGYCNRTMPYKEGEFAGHRDDRIMEAISEEEFANAVTAGGDEVGVGGRMRYMDVFSLSLLRPDGHPGRYQQLKKGTRDCLHWCEPGAIDTWNYLLMDMILRDDDGPRSS